MLRDEAGDKWRKCQNNANKTKQNPHFCAEFCFLLAFPGWLTVDGGFLQPSFLLHHDELSQYHIYNTSFPLLFPRVLFCPPLSPSPQSQEGHEGTSYCNHYAIRSSCKTAFGVSLTSYVWSVFDKAYTSHIMVFSVLYCGSTSDLCSWIYIIIKGIFGQIQADRIPNINANSWGEVEGDCWWCAGIWGSHNERCVAYCTWYIGLSGLKRVLGLSP